MSNLETLRKLVRQQTVAIGQPVRNLIGPVPEELAPLVSTADSSWLLLAIPGSAYVTTDEFYTTFAGLQDRLVKEIKADNGRVVQSVSEPVTFLLRGVTDVPGSTAVPIQVVTGAAATEWGIWVDGVLVYRGTGERDFSINLRAGRRMLEVVVAGPAFGIQFPASLRVLPLRDVLTAPIWAFATPGYADPQAGTPAVKLGWYNSARVGGWSILRRELTAVGPVYDTGPANGAGEFAVVVPGDVVAAVAIGATVYAGFEQMGVVLDVGYDAAGQVTWDTVVYTGITSMRVRLPADRDAVNEFWLGRTLNIGVFRELTRVQRTGADAVVTYTDAAVVYGAPYEYALQAYGLFDPAALSPLSDVRYVRAGDLVPPGPIIINGRDFQNPLPDAPAAPYPRVINRRVTVLFDTPEDEDYAGVRVRFLYVQQTGAPLSATETSLTVPLSVVGPTDGYIIEILTGPCVGQVREVVSISGQVLTLGTDDGWYDDGLGNPLPTTASTFRLYRYIDVFTDTGLPNTSDQLSFDVVPDPADPTLPLYGTYLFSSYDLAGNMQDPVDSVLWEYTTDDDTFLGDNQPPVVGLRQLSRIAQESYLNLDGTPTYPTMAFSVVELTARDPVDELVGVVIEYRGRKVATGTSDGANSPDTLNDSDALGVDEQGVIVSSDGWQPNEWQNYLVEILNGTGAGQQRLITSNTANQLVVSAPWTEIPDATSEYEIAWIGEIPADAAGTSIDDPHGVRTRYVAVAKSDGSNFLGVRAKDKEGVYSDLLFYRPDFDNIPEISSVEIRIDTARDLVFVSGSVDDDTQSFLWWLEPAGAGQPSSPDAGGTPNQDFSDTSVLKTFPREDAGTVNDIPFEFTLDDGERRTLVIRPYSGTNFTGAAGPDFRKEITRSPRTVYVWEPKDSLGNTSAVSVTIRFFCTPKIAVVHGAPLDDGTPTAFLTGADSATLTLTQTGANWNLDQYGVGEFASNPTTYTQFYVRVIEPTSGIEQFAKIIGNTADTLQLESWFNPAWWPNGAQTPQAGWPFEVRNGITWWRWWEAGATDEQNAAWIGTYDQDYFERFPVNPTYVQFYSQISGVPAEPVHTAVFDRDDLPSFETLSVNIFNVSQLQVSIDGWDDDTKSWICFARKNAPPTLGGGDFTGLEGTDGPQKTQLDPDFRRFEGLIKTATQFEMDVGDGEWYVTACPINSHGEYGTCLTKIKDVVVTTPVTPALGTPSAGPVDPDNIPVEGGDAYNLIRWPHNTAIASPATDVTMKIWGYRVDRDIATEEELTVDTGFGGGDRLPWQDSISGITEALKIQARSLDDDSVGADSIGTPYSAQGSFLHLTGQTVNGVFVPDKRGLPANGARQYTWRYRAKLYQAASEVWTSPGYVETTGYYQGTALVPTFVGTPTATLQNHGVCGLTPGTTAWPLVLLLQWSLDPTRLNGTDYGLRISADYITVFPTVYVTSVGTPSTGVANGSISFSPPQKYVGTARVLVSNATLTTNLQFLTHPGGDGVGYQDFNLHGGNGEIVEIRIQNPPASVTPLAEFGSNGLPNWSLETSPNGTPNGTLRIHNNLATTTQQSVWADYRCDEWIEGTMPRTFGFTLDIVKLSTGQVMETASTSLQVVCGNCASDTYTTN